MRRRIFYSQIIQQPLNISRRKHFPAGVGYIAEDATADGADRRLLPTTRHGTTQALSHPVLTKLHQARLIALDIAIHLTLLCRVHR